MVPIPIPEMAFHLASLARIARQIRIQLMTFDFSDSAVKVLVSLYGFRFAGSDREPRGEGRETTSPVGGRRKGTHHSSHAVTSLALFFCLVLAFCGPSITNLMLVCPDISTFWESTNEAGGGRYLWTREGIGGRPDHRAQMVTSPLFHYFFEGNLPLLCN